MARCHDCDRILREEDAYWRRIGRREVPLCDHCDACRSTAVRLANRGQGLAAVVLAVCLLFGLLLVVGMVVPFLVAVFGTPSPASAPARPAPFRDWVGKPPPPENP